MAPSKSPNAPERGAAAGDRIIEATADKGYRSMPIRPGGTQGALGDLAEGPLPAATPPARRRLLSLSLVLALAAGTIWAPGAPDAHEAPSGAADITRRLLSRDAIPSLPDNVLTALTVELAPGALAAPHRHDGFLFVYLLEGRVRSQLEGEPPKDYSAGDSWIEPAGVLHKLTQNLSESEPAKLLVVIVSAEDAEIRR